MSVTTKIKSLIETGLSGVDRREIAALAVILEEVELLNRYPRAGLSFKVDVKSEEEDPKVHETLVKFDHSLVEETDSDSERLLFTHRLSLEKEAFSVFLQVHGLLAEAKLGTKPFRALHEFLSARLYQNSTSSVAEELAQPERVRKINADLDTAYDERFARQW